MSMYCTEYIRSTIHMYICLPTYIHRFLIADAQAQGDKVPMNVPTSERNIIGASRLSRCLYVLYRVLSFESTHRTGQNQNGINYTLDQAESKGHFKILTIIADFAVQSNQSIVQPFRSKSKSFHHCRHSPHLTIDLQLRLFNFLNNCRL